MGLKKLQDKVAAHTNIVTSPKTKKIKTVETIKDENGEIVDIKETIIEQKIEKDEDVFLIPKIGKGSKLSKLKQSLMLQLKAERVERFNEEKAELEMDQKHDEENYLNEEILDKADQIESDDTDDRFAFLQLKNYL